MLLLVALVVSLLEARQVRPGVAVVILAPVMSWVGLAPGGFVHDREVTGFAGPTRGRVLDVAGDTAKREDLGAGALLVRPFLLVLDTKRWITSTTTYAGEVMQPRACLWRTT